ncbi:unnamed protein product [Polarella glacialis]|uniref:Uncharacterized protein n=1 Tax=Polarella glacialis TaxID=89957 RepID=A0A813D8X4_POLGL|nr:unnamed protein product [Polarella glacialis]
MAIALRSHLCARRGLTFQAAARAAWLGGSIGSARWQSPAAGTNVTRLVATQVNLPTAATAPQMKPLEGIASSLHFGHRADIKDACAPKALDLSHLQSIIAVARIRPKSLQTRAATRMPNEAGEWKCLNCGKFLTEQAFQRRSTFSAVPVLSTCKICNQERALAYNRTLRGNVRTLLSSARMRSRKRDQPCTLVRDDILDMLWQQKGSCAYSSVAMEELLPNSHWRMSLERKDNTKGYCRENCVLIAGEFNTSDYSRHPGVDSAKVQGTAQWSACKVLHVNSARHSNMDLSQLFEDLRVAQLKPYLVRPRPQSDRRISNIDGESRCSNCQIYKSDAEFNKHNKRPSGVQPYCRACSSAIVSEHRSTLRGFIRSLLESARRRSIQRAQEFALQPADLLEMMWSQRGRCYYSGVPLQYKLRHTDWQMSLERLDNLNGYTRQNCVLIALEFNTSDHSRAKGATLVFGTAQWSLPKVTHIWGKDSCDRPEFAEVQPGNQKEFS